MNPQRTYSVTYKVTPRTASAVRRKYRLVSGATALKNILTPVQMTYAKLVAEGLSNAGISQELGVSENFVKHKLSNIYEILGFRGAGLESRIALAVRYDRECEPEARWQSATRKAMHIPITSVEQLDSFYRSIS